MQPIRAQGPTRAVMLIGLGGLLLVLGPILPFLAGSAGGPFEGETLRGLEFNDGKLDFGVGVGLLAIAAYLWVTRSSFQARILGLLATTASLVILLNTATVDIPDAWGEPEINVGTGLYVVLLGAIIGLIGGVLSINRSFSLGRPGPGAPTTMPPPPPEPPSESPSSS